MSDTRRPWSWPVGESRNTPSSAASFGFDVAAELSRMNHPTARQSFSEIDALTDIAAAEQRRQLLRADLLARVLPFADESEVGTSSPRRGPVPMPSSAVGLGVPDSARRRAVGHWIALAVGFLLGRITRH